jgi:hypothetical protein
MIFRIEDAGMHRFTLGGHLPLASDQFGASFSSHIRMQFRNVGRFDNGGRWRRCAAS